MTEIDTLMDLDPLELSARDIDQIIAYHRKQRALFESGAKPAKEKGPKLDLTEVMAKLTGSKPAAPIKRRI